MKTYIMLGIPLLLTGAAFAQCSSAPQSHARLQWSKATKLVSPDGAWELEVQPVLQSNENHTPVRLRNCQGAGLRTLLTLQRSAEAYWGPGGKNLLIINESVANSSELLLFETASANRSMEDEAAQRIDDVVRGRLQRELGDGRAHRILSARVRLMEGK